MQYRYIYSVYTKNEDIVTNEPLLTGIDETPTYSKDKLFPLGLYLDEETGNIWGKPTVASRRDEYFITATFPTHAPLTVSIFIAVEEMSIPNNVYLYDPFTGDIITSEATYPIGKTTIFQAADDSGTAIAHYNIKGNIPGMVYDLNSGALKGLPSEYGSYKLDVSACNIAGCGNTFINITIVKECEGDKVQAVFNITKATGYFEFSLLREDGSTEIPTIRLDDKSNWEYNYCITPNKYSLALYNKLSSAVRYKLQVYTDGYKMIDTVLFGASSNGGTSKVEYIASGEIPTISYPKTIEWEMYEMKSFTPTTENTFTSFSLKPGLPKGLKFNTNTGELYGSPLETVENYVYIIYILIELV